MALASLVGAGCIFLVCTPILKSRIVEEWRFRRLGSPDPSERRSAAAALGEAGSLRAIPKLLELLAGTIDLQKRRYSYIEDDSGVRVYRNEGERIPLCFCNTGGVLRVDPKSVLFNALLRIVEKRGREAVAVMLQTLGREPPDSKLLLVIVSVLGRLGPEAAEALPALNRLRVATRKSDPTLWHLTVDAIWEIGDSPLFFPGGEK